MFLKYEKNDLQIHQKFLIKIATIVETSIISLSFIYASFVISCCMTSSYIIGSFRA